MYRRAVRGNLPAAFEGPGPRRRSWKDSRVAAGARSLLGPACALLLCAACGRGDPPPGALRFCTEVGCDTGLSVDFVRRPTALVRVEARGTGSAVYSIDCEERNRLCQGGVHFQDFTPDRVELRFITATDTFFQRLRPVYARRRPNGPDCPPECLLGRVRVELPAGW